MKSKTFTFLCLFTFILIGNSGLYARTITANTGLSPANWSNTTTWVNGVVPTAADTVIKSIEYLFSKFISTLKF